MQHRHLQPDFESEFKVKTRKLVTKILNSKLFTLSLNLRKYLSFYCEVVGSDKIQSKFDLFKPLYGIKKIKRAGWNRKEKGRMLGESVESVAAHMYGCILIAKFFLTDKLNEEESRNYPGYDKRRVIEILLFHDLAEYSTGDVPSDVKGTEDVRQEQAVWNHIEMLTSYQDIGDLNGAAIDWAKMQNSTGNTSAEHLNYRIARDIDKIENLVQLLVYKYDEQREIPDFEDFFICLYRKIETSFGSSILAEVCKPYRNSLFQFAKIRIML